MKAKRSLVLFLVSCLILTMVLCLGVAAHDGHDHDHATEEAAEGMSTHMLVSLIIAGVVVVGVAVFCIIKREFVRNTFRAYKSEMGKITWFPWKQVWRSTIFVVVSVVVVAAVLGLLDLALFEGQTLLADKVGGLFGGQ